MAIHFFFPYYCRFNFNQDIPLSISDIIPDQIHVTARSNGVRPGLSKGRYGYSCAQGIGKGGMSNKLLNEVTLDQPARMTLYTTLCGN
ncbi:unnamed protein product [Brassica oleracea]